MKIYLFKEYLGIPVSKTSSAIIFEFTVHTFIIILCGILFGSMKYFTLDLRIFLIVCMIIAMASLALSKYSGGLRKYAWFRKMSDFANDTKHSFVEGLKNIGRVSLIVCMLFVLILLAISRIEILLIAVGEPLGFVQVARGVLIASLITTLSMVPGGYVVREATLSFFLVQEGVAFESTLVIVLLDRILMTGSSFVLGVVASLIFMKRSAASH
jgi:uncharacterized membrane protein YbhN (UPF0104 family)